MTGIDLSPEMVERAAKRGCYNVLAVGNAESVVLLNAVANHPPTLNSPCYAEFKIKVVSVNVNRSRGRNVNLRCR